ncbi:MAG: hypothetical protein R6W78_09965 [Bacteroidales bacterium]
MKYFSQTIFTMMLCCLFIQVNSQNSAPQGFNYQAIARDYNGAEISNREILVRISVFAGQSGGDVVWREVHSTKTDQFGLFTLVIGVNPKDGGSKASFAEIQWGSAAHYLQVEIDFKDGKGYLPTGKNQLFSVPYALYANYAANGGSGGFYNRQNLAYTDSSFLLLINNDGTIQSSLKNDFDPTNEIQDLQLTGNILKITNNPDANDINLAPYLDNTDKQTLYNRNDSIGITNGNTISLKRFYQQLSIENDSLQINNGNAVSIAELRNPESIYFYANRTTSYTAAGGEYYTLKFDDVKTNVGSAFNSGNGDFTAIKSGLYSFYVVYLASESQSIYLYIENSLAETFVSNTVSQTYRLSFMRYLNAGEKLNLVIYNRLAASSPIGTGTFSGFKVY